MQDTPPVRSSLTSPNPVPASAPLASVQSRPEEPPDDITDRFTDSVKDLYGTLLTTRNLEIGLFWQRSNYFLVLNTGIALGFFNLDGSLYRLLFAAMGLIASALWLQVCLGGKYWQTRWEQRLMDFEAHHLRDAERVRDAVAGGAPVT